MESQESDYIELQDLEGEKDKVQEIVIDCKKEKPLKKRRSMTKSIPFLLSFIFIIGFILFLLLLQNDDLFGYKKRNKRSVNFGRELFSKIKKFFSDHVIITEKTNPKRTEIRFK